MQLVVIHGVKREFMKTRFSIYKKRNGNSVPFFIFYKLIIPRRRALRQSRMLIALHRFSYLQVCRCGHRSHRWRDAL